MMRDPPALRLDPSPRGVFNHSARPRLFGLPSLSKRGCAASAPSGSASLRSTGHLKTLRARVQCELGWQVAMLQKDGSFVGYHWLDGTSRLPQAFHTTPTHGSAA